MTKHRSPDERRAEILAAARTCYVENGYAHTRVEDIAKRAGLSKGGVYFHFESKRVIFDALLSEQQAATGALVARIVQGEGSAAEKLAGLGTAMLESFSNRSDHGKFLIVLAEMGIREPDIFERIRAAHEAYLTALEAVIRDGQRRGELRDIDARGVALLLKMIVDGIEQGIALGYDLDAENFAVAGLEVVFSGLVRQDR
jgi:AcrR family transcriptional regulator